VIENWEQYKDLEYYPDRTCACGCDGRIKVQSHHKYYGIPKYLPGHQSRDRKISEEDRKKQRERMTGDKNPAKRSEVRRKISESKIGRTKDNDDGYSKISKALTKPQEKRECAYRKCTVIFEVSITSKQRYCCISHGLKGKPPWNSGLTKETHLSIAKAADKTAKALIGRTKENDLSVAKRAEKIRGRNKENDKGYAASSRKQSGRTNPEQSKRMEQLWQDPEYISKQMKARGVCPNKAELFLDEFFQGLLPNEYKFVGEGKDRDFIIAGKCPDFVNINGQKKIIELFGEHVHEIEEEQQRIDLFANHGYQTLIIWYNELKDMDKLKTKVLEFNKVL